MGKTTNPEHDVVVVDEGERLTVNIFEILSCDVQMYIITFLSIGDLYHIALSCRHGAYLVLSPSADSFIWRSVAMSMGLNTEETIKDWKTQMEQLQANNNNNNSGSTIDTAAAAVVAIDQPPSPTTQPPPTTTTQPPSSAASMSQFEDTTKVKSLVSRMSRMVLGGSAARKSKKKVSKNKDNKDGLVPEHIIVDHPNIHNNISNDHNADNNENNKNENDKNGYDENTTNNGDNTAAEQHVTTTNNGQNNENVVIGDTNDHVEENNVNAQVDDHVDNGKSNDESDDDGDDDHDDNNNDNDYYSNDMTTHFDFNSIFLSTNNQYSLTVDDHGAIVDCPPHMWRVIVHSNLVKWDPASRTPDTDIKMHDNDRTISCSRQSKWDTIRTNRKLVMGMVHGWEYVLEDHDNSGYNSYRVFVGIERSDYAFTEVGFDKIIGYNSNGVSYNVGEHSIHRDNSHNLNNRSVLHQRNFTFGPGDTISIMFDLKNLTSDRKASMYLYKNNEYFLTIGDIPTDNVVYYPAISVIGRQRITIRMRNSSLLPPKETEVH